MELVFQFSIILLITFLGEVLRALIPLPIPAGIYGLILLFICLKTGLIPLHKIKKASDFMLSAMPVMFIGPCVGFMDICQEQGIAILYISLIAMVTTVLTMAVTGCSAQAVIRRGKERRHD
ncbi:MAG: CidA/LrgA family protein [Ruminococcaceae bacterium]|nr:CidA/LrgA family protein [Oscillospiraceae bacterium]